MDELAVELIKAAQRIASAKTIVARQRLRIAKLQAERRPTEDSQQLLDTFIKTLAALEAHERLLRDEAEGKHRSPEWPHSRFAAQTTGR